MNAKMKTRKESILSRIQSNCLEVDTGFTLHGEASPCHIWQGSTSGEGRGGGYGRISIDGHTSAVHRVVATHYFGYIPLKKQVDHKCNSRLCCNPYHLEIVTHRENQKRRAKRQSSTQCKESLNGTEDFQMS